MEEPTQFSVPRKPCLGAAAKTANCPPVVRFILEVLLRCRHGVDVIQTERSLRARVRERDAVGAAAVPALLKNTLLF